MEVVEVMVEVLGGMVAAAAVMVGMVVVDIAVEWRCFWESDIVFLLAGRKHNVESDPSVQTL